MNASKQSVAKQEQGYRTEQQNCGNCKHRTYQRTLPAWMVRANSTTGIANGRYKLEIHGQESAQKCGIGGFAIRKTATCTRWEPA